MVITHGPISCNISKRTLTTLLVMKTSLRHVKRLHNRSYVEGISLPKVEVVDNFYKPFIVIVNTQFSMRVKTSQLVLPKPSTSYIMFWKIQFKIKHTMFDLWVLRFRLRKVERITTLPYDFISGILFRKLFYPENGDRQINQRAPCFPF